MVKQVIVLRKDLNMRKGKMAAQAAHASMAVLLDRGAKELDHPHPHIDISLTPAMVKWLQEGVTKVVVGVDGEKELFQIYNDARRAKIPCSLIKDAGLTEFKEPTHTAVAIGPAGNKKVDEITGQLKLL